MIWTCFKYTILSPLDGCSYRKEWLRTCWRKPFQDVGVSEKYFSTQNFQSQKPEWNPNYSQSWRISFSLRTVQPIFLAYEFLELKLCIFIRLRRSFRRNLVYLVPILEYWCMKANYVLHNRLTYRAENIYTTLSLDTRHLLKRIRSFFQTLFRSYELSPCLS